MRSNQNYNIRFRTRSEREQRAWEILHGEVVGQDFRSKNQFVIEAINEYYDRYTAMAEDPYLETREKEDAFAERIVSTVQDRFLAGLPEILTAFFLRFGVQMPVGTQIMPRGFANGHTSEATLQQKETGMEGILEPEENDLIDFEAFG